MTVAGFACVKRLEDDARPLDVRTTLARHLWTTRLLLLAAVALPCGCKKRSPSANVEAGAPAQRTSAAARATTSASAAPAASAAPPTTNAFESACRADHERSAKQPRACGGGSAYDECVAIDDSRGWFASILTSELDEHAFGDIPMCRFTWTLVYVDLAKGTRDKTKPRPGVSLYGEEGLVRLVSAGNGAVFAEVEEKTPSGGHHTQNEGTVFVAREGKIERFPGVSTVRDVKDVDGDGLVDFVLASPFVTAHQSNAGGIPVTTWVEGPSPVAHRLPDGTLAFADETAQSLARKKCPTKPGAAPKLERADPEGGALGDTAEMFAELETWVMCSRLWGATAAELKKGLGQCKSYSDTFTLDGDESSAEKLAAGACPSHLQDWATVKLPFVLTKP